VEGEDEFAEEGVGPGEPGAGEVGGVVFVEAFVHESGAGVGGAVTLPSECVPHMRGVEGINP